MMRSVLLAFLCLGASTARAADTLPGGATINFNRLLLHENNEPELQEPETPESQLEYFNLAHCVCSLFNYNGELPDFFEGTFAWELTVENATTPVDRPIEIWTGTDCDNEDPTVRDANCFKTAASPGTVAAIQQAGAVNVEIPIYDLMTPTMRMGCMERDLSGTTWALVDGDANGTLEYAQPSMAITTDSKPPPLPINFRAVGAENAVELSWDPPAEGVSDVAYYQALCASTLSGAPAKTTSLTARYQTPRQLCGAPQDATLMPTVLSTGSDTEPDAGDSLQLPEELARLSPSFLCGETASSTARSMRIEGLENNTPYTVVFLAIDRSGNARGTYFTSPLVPKPATDFWEDLHDRGSQVEGGLCLLAQAYGDGGPLTDGLRAFRDETLAETAFGRWLVDVYYGTIGTLDLHGSLALRIAAAVVLFPFVVVALLWHALTLPGLIALVALGVLVRRRRRIVLARLAAASTVAFVALVPARAHAQVPYWEEAGFTDPSTELPPGDPERVSWHAGLRFGPYVPGIDAQLGMPVGPYAGPYEQMFGGYSVLPMVDLDRILWRGFGQLGVGISIGYMGKKARAWVADSDPMDEDRPRAEGDNNKFRMIPTSLNAVYRFTQLDDNYGIPIVPYARGGLAYHLWWITAPNGDIAESCIGPNTSETCGKTSALGGSLGFVGSIGIAIRAERIDADATRSMRESGIEHAGFYAEYSFAKVDGFGSDKKLSVGDATWFVGVDFEF